VKHQGKGKTAGKFKMNGKEGVLFSLGIPEGLVVEVKPGLADGAYPSPACQGFKKAKEPVESSAPGLRRVSASRWSVRPGSPRIRGPPAGKLGMYGIAEPERSGAFLKGLLGELFLKEKFLPVPGAGRAGYAKGPPFFFGLRMASRKIKGVGMGVAGHSERVYFFIGIKKTSLPSDNNIGIFREVIP
jgi:hypothetical protein